MEVAKSPLREAREARRWSRLYVEIKTERRIPKSSLQRWEETGGSPRSPEQRDELCTLFGKTAEQLWLDKGHDIIKVDINIQMSEKEDLPMSDLVRRAFFTNLGSRLTSMIDLWPRRNYRYEELQREINKAVYDSHLVADSDVSRREALKSVALVPIGLYAGHPTSKKDTDTLLKHTAAAIAVCWYMRRGKDLVFTSGLVSEYIQFLKSLVSPSSAESYRKAAAGLLSQCFRLKGALVRSLTNNEQTYGYFDEAIRYAEISGNTGELAMATRVAAAEYWWQGKHAAALPYAQRAHALISPDTPATMRSFIASALALCQVTSDNSDEAETTLAEAFDLFDPTTLVTSAYSEAILVAIAAAVKQRGGQWEESVALYEKSLVTPDLSALGAVQNRINYAKTEVARDDRPRDMDLCMRLVREAMSGATELGSERYKQEAKEAYGLFKIAWPREAAIKQFGKDHGWL